MRIRVVSALKLLMNLPPLQAGVVQIYGIGGTKTGEQKIIDAQNRRLKITGCEWFTLKNKNFINGAKKTIPPENDSTYKRILAIGDVHGYFGKRMSLWEKIFGGDFKKKSVFLRILTDTS